jgi:hypothetical protein
MPLVVNACNWLSQLLMREPDTETSTQQGNWA